MPAPQSFRIGIVGCGRISQYHLEAIAKVEGLTSCGIRPGVEFEVVERAPFGGPLTLRIAGAPRQLGPQLAAHVVIVPGAG